MTAGRTLALIALAAACCACSTANPTPHPVVEDSAVDRGSDTGDSDGIADGSSGDAGGTGDNVDVEAGPPDVPPSELCPGLGFEPELSPARGIFPAGPLVVTVTPSPSMDFYVTTDGQPPLPGVGAKVSSPLSVIPIEGRAAAVIRVGGFIGGEPCGSFATHTYVFEDALWTQSVLPASVPDIWGNEETTAADYAMDPDVVDAAAYASARVAGLHDVPVASLVLSPEDIFGVASGAYMNPEETGDAWERPTSLEIIGAGSPVQTGAGLRIQGGTSTHNWKSPKLSMRVSFEAEYGATKLDHPLFTTGPVTRFDSLVLDAHLNETWIHPEHVQRERATYLRDRFVADVLQHLGWPAPRGRYMHLFLQGIYWGLYEVHERPDASFCAQLFGGDKDDWDVIKHDGSVVDGDAEAWDTMMEIARDGVGDDEAFEVLTQHVAVEGFIDYMLVNFWAGNTDWPRHNWYAVKRRQPLSRWRFVSWDAEHVLEKISDDATGPKWWSTDNTPGELFEAMLDNDGFRDQLAERANELLGAGGLLSSEPEAVARGMYAGLTEQIVDAVVLESARWGDYHRADEPYTRDVEWSAEVAWILDDWFAERPAVVAEQLEELDLDVELDRDDADDTPD